MLLMLSRTNDPELRTQVFPWVTSAPVFGVDVDQLQPGKMVIVNEKVPGFPFKSLHDIPPGDYYVQALLNIYTDFHRSDGHVIWAHMDQWEGQQITLSPGNLYSKAERVHLDGAHSARIKLSLTETIPAIPMPNDTEWVQRIKIRSPLLSQFWGRPIFIGAVILLPHDYSARPQERYPVIYQQGHFAQDTPFGFTGNRAPEKEEERKRRESYGVETAEEFYQTWTSGRLPRMIAVSFLHPTPFYDDSYAVNSANVGPYDDALMTELIPYIEEHYRIIREPYARVLTGGSTGGWEALALQLHHPKFFGGTWALYPDSPDLRHFFLINLYEDKSLFVKPQRGPAWITPQWWSPERFVIQGDDGQPIATMRQLSEIESVLGSKGRSGGFLHDYVAVFGPVGTDGYPKPLWDEVTGEIDHDVANYMRDHGYDLRHYAEVHWPEIGAALGGKLHFICGDADNFYLNLGVYSFEEFLQSTRDPHEPGSFEYGRPLKGHGWQPVSNVELIKRMANHVVSHARPGSNHPWLAD